jgi:hypothetical protein
MFNYAELYAKYILYVHLVFLYHTKTVFQTFHICHTEGSVFL